MGLLSFAKNIGSKLFSKPEEAPKKITSHIEEDNPGISDLEVGYDNGVVTLKGTPSSQDALEKAVLMAGNVEGVSEVQYEEAAVNTPTVKVEYYEIASGDTLSGIAKKYYGDSSKYMLIFEANREVIKDPDKIYVGQKIRIPLES